MDGELTYKIKTFYFTQLDESIPKACMKILISPDERKKPHQIVVGDSTGKITFFEMKDSTLVPMMSTESRGKSPARFEKISKMGKLCDKFMTAYGAQVAAFNNQGKEYFSFDSNLAETLKWATAEESKFVFACGEFNLNFYEIISGNIEDTYQYICPSEILDYYVDCYDGVGYYVLLSCVDKRLRVLNSKGLVYEVKIDSNVYSFYPMVETAYDFANKRDPGKRYMLMGLSNGEVRCYQVSQFEAKFEWTIKPLGKESKSEAQFIRYFRISGRDYPDIVVVRADMTVDIYSNKGDLKTYEKIASTQIESSITAVECVFFSGVGTLLLTTFSGKILGLTLASEYQIHTATEERPPVENLSSPSSQSKRNISPRSRDRGAVEKKDEAAVSRGSDKRLRGRSDHRQQAVVHSEEERARSEQIRDHTELAEPFPTNRAKEARVEHSRVREKPLGPDHRKPEQSTLG